MKTLGRSSQEPAHQRLRWNHVPPEELTPTISFPEIIAPSTMDLEGRIITLEFDTFSWLKYTPNAGDGSETLGEERQVWKCQICWVFGSTEQENQSLRPETTT